MHASMKWRIIFVVASPPTPFFCWWLVWDGGGEVEMAVREVVALPTRMSMRQADSSFVENILLLGKP